MGFNLVKNKKIIGKCLDFCQVTDAHGFNFMRTNHAYMCSD